MTPYERLLAEAIPTGTFGGNKPPPPTWSPTAQAQHIADLEAALNGWEYTADPRRLRAVPNPPSSPTQPAEDTTAA